MVSALRQKAKDGTPLVKLIEAAGAIPGIKVDEGAKDLACCPGEKVTVGLDKLREAVFVSYERWNRRVPTPHLNRWLREALERHAPPATKGRRVKIRFMTQPSTRPPTFVAFCQRANDMPLSYMRYLTNSLRDAFGLPGVPIRFKLRKGENPFADG